MPQPEEAGAVPSWLVPAGIGIVLMLILTSSKGKSIISETKAVTASA
jgi:hypothetical protein